MQPLILAGVRNLIAIWFILTIVACVAPTADLVKEDAGMRKSTLIEPNMEIASNWWRDLENIWTPIGWKDHVCRFNVLFDGTIVMVAHRHANRLPGCGEAQFTFNTCGVQPGRDDHYVAQAWNDSTAPVLRSEWPSHGMLLRQEIFAHVPGGGDIQTGIEPLFAWIRLSVQDICEGLPVPSEANFHIKINRPFVNLSMDIRKNMLFDVEQSLYPNELHEEAHDYDPASGFRVLEKSGLVRMAVAPGQKCWVGFASKQPTERDSLLTVNIAAKKGNYVDLLIPYISAERAVLDKELSLGYDAALAQADSYWSKIPATAATFDVPEDYINQAIKRSLQFAEIIAEKDPNTGNYSLLTGSLMYSWGLWVTPNSMTMNLLDMAGYHSVLEKYLDIFRNLQGTVVPPGPQFKLHPGYLSSPKTLTAVDWLTDHGALLWAISEHALLTGDNTYINKWLPTVEKACDFIKDSRRIEGHGGVPGIMPPAVASDQISTIQAIWSDGWNYKGLITAVKLLKEIHHPRAAEFEAEARDYKAAFVKAIREKSATLPAWTDSKGKVHHQAPTAMFGEQDWQLRHPFHLDTGPLFLVFSGLMDADDDMMKSTLSWFREGPPTRFFRPNSDCWQLPSLVHEISSCEPCYSWNIFHSWQAGDRYHFLEGMYSLFAGAMSRQTYSLCETRGGLTGVTPCTPAVLLVRLAVIDDKIKDDELHLLRLAPLAWLSPTKEARFENMPTEFGPVTLRFKLARQGKELNVTFSDQFRSAPSKIVLHIPPVKGLTNVTLNGKDLKWNAEAEELIIR